MAIHTGVNGSVVVVIAGTTATVTKVSEFSVEIEPATTEFRILGDVWQNRVYVGNDASGTFTAQWDPADTSGQVALTNAALGGTAVLLKLYDTASNYWQGSAFINGLSQAVSNDEVVSREFSFGGTGAAWTYT